MTRITRFVAVAAALALAATAARADDGVAASFERMLSQPPHHGATATRAPVEADPLLAALVLPLRGEPATPAPVVADAASPMAGFVRLFEHTASTHRPPLPAGTDPLRAVLVEPLRQQLLAEAHRPQRIAAR